MPAKSPRKKPVSTKPELGWIARLPEVGTLAQEIATESDLLEVVEVHRRNLEEALRLVERCRERAAKKAAEGWTAEEIEAAKAAR